MSELGYDKRTINTIGRSALTDEGTHSKYPNDPLPKVDYDLLLFTESGPPYAPRTLPRVENVTKG